jgi:hypothetical protein
VSAPARSKRTATSPASDIARRRLAAQRISAATFTRPAEVVAHLGAVQAQDYLGALWAVGLRLADARQRDVEQALADRSIVRSWPMRGTLHFLAADDARWMIELLAPRVAASAANRLRAMGIDTAVLARARRALTKQLEGGRRLTRPAAYDVLERAGIATVGQRGLHVLWRLAHDGLLCFGPREGKQQTFVLLEEWLPGARPRPRDEALPELARRYFAGHGPATVRDFAWWSGLTLADARRATEMAGTLVAQEIIAGEPYWFAPAVRAARSVPTAREGDRAHALPAFDELFVGYADRSAAIPAAHAKRLTPFEVLGPVIVLDGHLVATWKRRIAGAKVAVSTSPLAPLGRADSAAVDRALARYARFLEVELLSPFSTRRDGSSP